MVCYVNWSYDWCYSFLTAIIPKTSLNTEPYSAPCYGERERDIKFIGLFGDRGHRGPYSPYKPCNHNLYIEIIIFPHVDNPKSKGYNQPKKKTLK